MNKFFFSLCTVCISCALQAQPGSTGKPGSAGANTNAGAAADASAEGAAAMAAISASLQVTNPFDDSRKMWPDRVPPPPAPAPPPPPPAVTDQDMQLYGVVITPEGKRATVKVGQRFAHLAPAGRAFVTLVEGQSLGEFTLSAVQPDHLLLRAQTGEQRVYFTRKTDRGALTAHQVAATPAPVQDATNAPPQDAAGTVQAGVAAPSAPVAAAPAQQPGTAPAVGLVPPGNGAAPAAPSNDATAAAAAPFNLRNSLAAALEAARNNRPATPAGAGNAGANPFQKP